MSSSSTSSSSTSRRTSSDHSVLSNSSTVFSPTIVNPQTFKNHSRNVSKTFGNLTNAFIPHDQDSEHLELNEKGLENQDVLLPQYLPRSPSLEPFSSFTNLSTKLTHPHIGLRRRRLLSQVLAILGIIALLGWWVNTNGYMGNAEKFDIWGNDGKLMFLEKACITIGLIQLYRGLNNTYSYLDISEGGETKLPGIIIGSDGKDLLKETKLELSHAEKMAELANIKPQEWGLKLSIEHFLGGLRKFPENQPIKSALSILGTFADEIYLNGPTNKRDYFYQMREFSKEIFPKKISENLINGLINYIGHPDQSNFDEIKSEENSKKDSWDFNKHIWQTDKNSQKKGSKEISSWKDGKAFDEGWEWDLLTDFDADQYVTKRLAGSRLKEMWDNLPSGILRSDTLRYLLILLEGGIYTDTDTTLLKSPSEWGHDPKLFKGGDGWLTENQLERAKSGESIDDIIGKPSVIVGLEADVGDREDWFDWWPRPIQIVQWTISSAPNHPIALNALLRIYHSTVKAIEWSPVGVMAWTGPGVWTDAVLSYLRVKYGLVWTDLKDLTTPMRIGDVVILPITGFSPGVGNFGAQMSNHPQAMVEHKFAGSWKEKDKSD
uniref:Alpha 1,6-mannosyltransferase n=1 Tax=Kwoniella pini CBS 10737 TaxID=1296096 RepID=A0A1B9HU19_9TREE|nr:uncharacterized protein I206_07154 [Kwoniella pini CBS 10737]OCF46767.1 hypothetical protein I206_07154 [Kwoniella pini CBS 10737]